MNISGGFFSAIINELGPTGLLVIGLYFILYRPMKSMAGSLRIINHELGAILAILKRTVKEP
jgi:hypothetical protein